MTDPENTNPEQEGKPEQQEGKPEGDGAAKALKAERDARARAEREAREARQRADELERAERVRAVAAERNLSDQQAGFLTGDTEEELAASADALTEAFKPAEEASESRRTRPKERLKPGAVSSAEPQDLGAVADDVLKRW
ncbi:MAG: hypothetical protein WD844_16270 [Thermoleophilaceae bacterium]